MTRKPFPLKSSILIGSIFLFSCSFQEKKDVDFNAALDDYFIQHFPANEPGGAVLIMKGDRIIFSKGYGVADINTQEAITPNTLFNLGSISKTFVANAILILQTEGKLSVEDSLIQYFPDFKNKEIAKKVKIKHLLTHTSGLPDIREVAKDSVFYLTAKDDENWAPIMRAEKLNFDPGSNFEYSNPAFNGLALIVEQVSKMRWQKFIKEKIMLPSGMSTSTITDGPHPEAGVAHAYVYSKDKWLEDDYGEEPTFPAAGNGGVWSSVEELAKYELAIQKSVFLKPEVISASRSIKEFDNWKGTEPPFIGWSWFINRRNDLDLVGHEGDQGGFLCSYLTLPEKEIFVVILCNTRRDVPGFSTFVLQLLKEHNYMDQQ